ncbi:MAG: TonB-dependent receptor plug domain-containing protein [Candidatus Sulfotelmatobacter sp.]
MASATPQQRATPSIVIVLSVIDDKSEAVPQAQIQIHAQGQLLATALTDAAGRATATLQGHASLQLTVSKQGYLATSTVLEIKASTRRTEVEVVLSKAELSQQSVEVHGTPSNPVAEESSSQATIAPEQAQDTPGRPATLADTLPLVPGVVRTSDGSVRIAGYGENHSALLVNSVDVTDPATGMFGLTVPIDSVQNVSVSEMPYLAQYGKFTAGVVTAETRQGEQKWHYALNDPLPDFRIRSAHLEGLKDASPRLDLSGPLIDRKLYFLEDDEYAISKSEVYTLPFPLNQTTSTAINSFTQLTEILSPNQTLSVSFHLAPHLLTYSGLDYFNPQPVTPDINVHESTGTVIHRLAIGEGLLQNTVAITRVSTGIDPQGNSEMILTPIGNQGNYFGRESRLATRVQWIENWRPRNLHFLGEHSLQIGSVVAHAEDAGDFIARPVLIENSTGQPASRIDFSGAGSFSVSDLEPSLYVQDHWLLRPNLALDLGTRWESQTITHTVRIAPRAGFAWTPDRSQTTVIRGGLGIFYDNVPLNTYAFSSYPQQTVTLYNSSGGVAGSPIQYINLTEQAAESKFPFIDSAQKSGNFAPYTVGWNVELDRSFSPFMTLRVKYLQGQAHDMLTIQPEVVQNQPALVLSSTGFAQTRQLEFIARFGGQQKRQIFFSYVRQYARGTVNDANTYLGNLPFPIMNPNLVASLPSEIPNRFLLWGMYSLPRKFRVMPKIEDRSGFPYQPTNVLQQYITSIPGAQPRFPRYFSFDLRASKDIQVTPKHAIRLSATVMNLTNHFNALEIHSNVADPQYGRFFGNINRKVLFDFDFLF